LQPLGEGLATTVERASRKQSAARCAGTTRQSYRNDQPTLSPPTQNLAHQVDQFVHLRPREFGRQPERGTAGQGGEPHGYLTGGNRLHPHPWNHCQRSGAAIKQLGGELVKLGRP
jgi:hypothetical protein